MPLLLGAIGGFISLTAIVTGVSVTIANAVKSSGATQSQIEEKFEAIESKECKVFFTDKNEKYMIVSCSTPETWYFFDSKKNSLETIQGITTKNRKETQLGFYIEQWKDKSWQVFKNFDQRYYKGSNVTGDLFQIDYKFGTKDFPYAKYIQSYNCDTPIGTRMLSQSDFKCNNSDIYIPTSEFKKTRKQENDESLFNKTFSLNGERKCFAKDKNNKWRKINCDTPVTRN